MRTLTSDVCIIGGGISAALLAQKLALRRPGLAIRVVEAGRKIFDFENRTRYRQRWMDYGENPWPRDFIPDQAGQGIISRTLAVGGSALHWGGVTNRFSEEDLRLRSLYGLAVDWPITWRELERYYCEAERVIGVAGEPSPFPEDRRSEPYPMPPMPLSYNLRQLSSWANKSGIPFGGTPQAKNTVEYDGRAVCKRCNTCEICPTGARYSPDFTFLRLLEQKKIALHDETLVRRLVLHDARPTVVRAEAVETKAGDGPVAFEAGVFVVASGYAWTSHLLLLSAQGRFPSGLANTSGLVGRYLNGHAFVGAQVELDLALYPGMNEQHSLISRQFFRCASDKPFVRHDLRVWESPFGREPRLRDAPGGLLMGDALLQDWRGRARRGAARLRAYHDVHPARESALHLDPARRNRFGDPLPRIEHHLDEKSRARDAATKQHVRDVFARLARNDGGKVLAVTEGDYLDHPAGGCRMGEDPAQSVCDSHGRSHDHENLWIVGAPTLPTGGCTNGTLTFAALTLRSADRIADTLGARSASIRNG
jgi:quinoprotein glucose dehydrogenase